MNNKKTKTLNRMAAVMMGILLGMSSALLFSACSVDSADSVSRSVDANVSGVYRNSDTNNNNGRLVANNSGGPITQLDLRQGGDQLEGIDNNGIVFRGTIGRVVDNLASFNLEGRTTAGNAATISGNIEVSGGQGVMRGTWIEDSLFSTVFGVANGPSIVSNAPINTNTNGLMRFIYNATPMTPYDLALYRKTALWFYEG